MNIHHPTAFNGLTGYRNARLRNVLYVASAPAALAIVEIFHPHAHNLLALDVPTWLTVHYVQAPLFALSAFAVASLVRTQTGLPARVCRVAMFTFALCFVVFDTAAGLVVGDLVQTAHASASPGAWLAPIDSVWSHPILGGTNRPLVALIGRVSLSIGTVAAAVSLRRAGRPWLPVLLLALSGCVMYLFPTHAWPGGPLTFGGMAIAAAWLQWTRPRVVVAKHRTWRRRVQHTGWRMDVLGRRVAMKAFQQDHAPRRDRRYRRRGGI
jgi:hypothetical protein